MKRYLYPFLLILLALVSCASKPRDKYYNSVAVLAIMSPDGQLAGSATGFAISPNMILTAGHFCIHAVSSMEKGEINETITVIGSDIQGSWYKIGEADIVDWSTNGAIDACLLYLPDHKLVPLKLARSFNRVHTEDIVTSIGAPNGTFPVRRDGRIASLSPSGFTYPFNNMILIAIEAQPGCSGSPVIWHGLVVGMLVAVPDELIDSALASKSITILPWLEPLLKE